MSMPALVLVEAFPNYQLRLQFDDGTNGVIDLSNLAGKGVFRAWDDNNLFFKPYINDMGAVAWNDVLDIDSLNAYLTLKNNTFDAWKQHASSHVSD